MALPPLHCLKLVLGCPGMVRWNILLACRQRLRQPIVPKGNDNRLRKHTYRIRMPHKSKKRKTQTKTGGGVGGVARFEEVPDLAGHSLGVFRYERPRFERGWHYHPEAELTLILESSGTRLVGDHIGDFAPGDLVLLGPNLPHVWRTDRPPTRGGGRARSIYVHFHAEWFTQITLLPELDDVRKLLARAGRGLWFGGASRDEAARRIEALHGCHGLRRLTAFWELLQILAEAQMVVPLSSVGFAPVLDEAAGARIRRVHQYVYEHFRTGIVHADLARAAGMSPSALSKFFRRTTGRTITEFITEVRVGEAARCLIDTDDYVSEIAFAAGFESLAHFNSVFRRLKQMNPSRFRELHHTE
jgi:AraC-like DNA-binding protein